MVSPPSAGAVDASRPFRRRFLLERHVASGEFTPPIRRRGTGGASWPSRISVRQRHLRHEGVGEGLSRHSVDARALGHGEAAALLFRGDALPLAAGADDDDDSTAVPTEDDGSTEDDFGSWFDGGSAKDQLELDVAGYPTESDVVATRLTVLDECMEVRGDYKLLPQTFHNRPCYQKEDGVMFLFFMQQRWRFGSALGCPSDDLEAPTILEGTNVPGVELAAPSSTPPENRHCVEEAAGHPLPFQSNNERFFRAPCTSRIHAGAEWFKHASGRNSRSALVRDEVISAAHCVDPTHVSVISDNSDIHGDYRLMPQFFNRRPCYRKEGSTICLFFSDEHRRWRFAWTLGGASPGLGDDQWCAGGLDLEAPRADVSRAAASSSPMQCASASKASQLTVIDDSDAVRGEYCLVSGLLNGRQYYRKEDGSSFLFFDDSQHIWRFSETLGGEADDAAEGSRGITVLPPEAPGQPSLGASLAERQPSGATVVASASSIVGAGDLETQGGAMRLTVIDDNEQIAGEYQLLPELFQGHPCYRKGDDGLFLCFDGDGQMSFSPFLGQHSGGDAGQACDARRLALGVFSEECADDAVDSQSSPASSGCEHRTALRGGSGRGAPAVGSHVSPRTSCAGCMVQ